MQQILTTQRWPKQHLILGCCSLLASSFLIFRNPTMGIVGILAGIYWLFPSSRSTLKLDKEGFTFPNGMFGEKTIAWSEVSTFSVVTEKAAWFIPIRSYVGWTLVSSKTSIAGKTIGWLAGFNGCLQQNYGMEAKELAALLEQYRLQSLNRRFS